MPRQAKTRSLTTAFHKNTKPNQTYMSKCKDNMSKCRDIPYACTGREQYGYIRQAMQTFRKSQDNSGKANNEVGLSVPYSDEQNNNI